MKLIFVFCATFLVALAQEIEKDEGVLVLKTDKFDDVINNNDYVLVEFYAPWCGHCKALAPEYAKAAQTLSGKGSTIQLGKVDATEEEALAKKYEIKGYPTLKFFRKGIPIDYSGGRDADAIVGWVEKKTGPAARDLKTVDEAKQFVEENKIAIIGFFKDQESDKAKAYLSVANSVDDYSFAITSEDSILAQYETSCGSIILFKKFDEGKAVFEGDHNEKDIKGFIVSESLPNLIEFNSDSAPKIFGGEIKSHLLIFLSKSSDKSTQLINDAGSIAKPYKSKILFVTIDVEEEDHQRILEFFGINKDEEIPTARIIKLEEEMTKYKPEATDLNAVTIKDFVDKFLEGTLKPHLLSQTLPADWDKEPVKVLVSGNFDSVAFDKTKDVLVEFYAPWCGHCKQLAPIYDKVAEHFKDNKDVVVGKLDATVNELEHTRITSFPTLKLYKKGDDNKGIEYRGPRSFEDLVKFIESGGVEPPVEQPVEGETDDEDVHPKDEL